MPHLAASRKRFAIFCGMRIEPGDAPSRRSRGPRLPTSVTIILHTECRSVLGILDDLELQLRPNDRTVAIPVAACTRYYEFGVNRRLEKLRRELREN